LANPLPSVSEERSNRLAHYLLAQGVTREQPVVIYGHRSPAVVISILATLKAGKASPLFYVVVLAAGAGAAGFSFQKRIELQVRRIRWWTPSTQLHESLSA